MSFGSYLACRPFVLDFDFCACHWLHHENPSPFSREIKISILPFCPVVFEEVENQIVKSWNPNPSPSLNPS